MFSLCSGKISVLPVVNFNFFLFLNSKSKPETPKTPSTPSTPLSPSFSPAGGPLSPHLLTGDSVRDKCIEMLSAALRTDGSKTQKTPNGYPQNIKLFYIKLT